MGRPRHSVGKGKGKNKGKGKGKGNGKSIGSNGKGNNRSDRDDGREKKRRVGSGIFPTKAVLITSSKPSMCTKATQEAIGLLRDSLDFLHPGWKTVGSSLTAEGATKDMVETDANETKPDSVGSLLDAELAEIRADAGIPSHDRTSKVDKIHRHRVSLYSEVLRGISVISMPSAEKVKTGDVEILAQTPDRTSGGNLSNQGEDTKLDTEVGAGEARPINDDGVHVCPMTKNERTETIALPAPTRVVKHVFDAMADPASGGRVARFVVRMLPLDIVCSPHMKNFKVAATEYISKVFADVKEGSSWRLLLQSRAMNTLKKEDVLPCLKEILNPLNMDMSVCDAEYTILVEVNPSLCGISVIQDFAALHDCNLQVHCKAAGRTLEDCDEEGGGNDGSSSPPPLNEAGMDDASNASKSKDEIVVHDDPAREL